MDILMPGLDAARPRADSPLPKCARIPILGITAGVTEELRESCRRNGWTRFSQARQRSGTVESVRFYLARSLIESGVRTLEPSVSGNRSQNRNPGKISHALKNRSGLNIACGRPVLLALLYLFAGAAKLMMPAAAATSAQTSLPVGFCASSAWLRCWRVGPGIAGIAAHWVGLTR